MTDAEIAGIMNWRGPGAYTVREMNRVREVVVAARSEAKIECAMICETLQAPDGQRNISTYESATIDCAEAILRSNTNSQLSMVPARAECGLLSRIETHIRQLSPHMMQRDGVVLLHEAAEEIKRLQE